MLQHVVYIDDINAVLAQYGRALYAAGKPYNQFAETINTLTSKRPALRRLMQGAWDVAFSWLHAEPGSHHIAMPFQVLLAMLAVSLNWGWTAFAGWCLALGWGALCRAGELFAACRADLLLPRDVNFTVAFGLLAIHEPKARRTGAKHQSAKLDVPDLLDVVDFCFGSLRPAAPLWPWTGQTFRNRFRVVLSALRLPTQKIGNMKTLDPGSLRSGGATWHLQMTEDGEYTRRKGRWLSTKIMEIYVQETASLLYLKRIPETSRIFTLEMARISLDLSSGSKICRVGPCSFCMVGTPTQRSSAWMRWAVRELSRWLAVANATLWISIEWRRKSVGLSGYICRKGYLCALWSLGVGAAAGRLCRVLVPLQGAAAGCRSRVPLQSAATRCAWPRAL